ncbi:Flp pilus assembly protein CpaB [Pseudarthrobacter phenanthrenivorans Sphe3]|uniref:Flp pilus assembly protein CpaB n=1 Tax=Pseudarthrobacter phenanthrenivorans (strain DSM 18606 / JCM 16027 / LMG 23796 / Sphe3) TaxID=930171 RepID=F0M9V6_PSEPM|nr:SAF domain-containing protein [Pseudarthrobacter phenanthrenivorans]ADX73886.1 Flp pilus assembly protein CpaB [Pseudarthrobacter phenanthrenivorans Sphe3]
MKSRLLGGLAALLLAVVGAALLFVYVQGASARAQAGLEPVNVLVVKEKVPAGTKTSDLSAKLRVDSIPKSAVPAGALTSLDQQEGKVTAVALEPGEQLMATRLVDPRDLAPGTVPVPEGLEEVTLLLSPERILGGRLEAGDTVTIYSSFDKEDGQTGLLFHDVLITAVQKAPSDSKNNSGSGSSEPAVEMPNGSAFITFARSDSDASKLIYSAEFGKLWLAKQSESTVKSTPPVTTFGGLF